MFEAAWFRIDFTKLPVATPAVMLRLAERGLSGECESCAAPPWGLFNGWIGGIGVDCMADSLLRIAAGMVQLHPGVAFGPSY